MWVLEVVQVESPVHQQEVLERVAEAAGVNRIGPRVRLAMETAVALAAEAEKLKRSGNFLWLPGMATPPLRDRSTLSAASRDIDLISPEELSGVIRKVVGDAFGLAAAEVAPAVARLLGFVRCTDYIRERIELVMEQMFQDNKLVRQGEQLLLPRPK
jgi:hypothetical protein